MTWVTLSPPNKFEKEMVVADGQACEVVGRAIKRIAISNLGLPMMTPKSHGL